MNITTENGQTLISEVKDELAIKCDRGDTLEIKVKEPGFEFKYGDTWYKARKGKIKPLNYRPRSAWERLKDWFEGKTMSREAEAA